MNTWTKLILLAVVILCLGDSPDRVTAQDRSRENATSPKTKAFMRKKLVASEQIMEGLTTPSYGLIKKGATTMILMNKEAMWATHHSPSYAQDSADFVRSAERIIRLANAKDLEGASHTYAQLTIQCVTCHRRVRGQKVAESKHSALSLTARR